MKIEKREEEKKKGRMTIHPERLQNPDRQTTQTNNMQKKKGEKHRGGGRLQFTKTEGGETRFFLKKEGSFPGGRKETAQRKHGPQKLYLQIQKTKETSCNER